MQEERPRANLNPIAIMNVLAKPNIRIDRKTKKRLKSSTDLPP
jgi:hypothetical protein